MGLYIRPASNVENDGIRIDIPASFHEAEKQLRDAEHLAAIATRQHGKVALLIESQADFDHVLAAGCDGLYIIESYLAHTAT